MPTWTSNIPSQVKTHANVGAFPPTGSVKTIYIAEDTNIAYYWTGSAYQPISVQDLSVLVAKSDYTPAHSLLAQQSGTGTPTSVPIGTNEILGRLSGGGADIKGLSTSEVKGLLDLSGTNTGDQTFITPRVQSVTSSATVTPTSTNDIVRITAQAEALTLANPTGTFLEGQSLVIRIKDNGTARSIGYGSDYRAIGVTLPTTTVVNKTTYLGCIWNETDSKLDIIGVCTEV